MNRAFVRAIHELTSRLADGPFSDCFWGVVTAADEQGAVEMAAETEALSIRRVVSESVEGCDLDAFESGEAYDELRKGRGFRKAGSSQQIDEFKIVGDSTLLLAASIENPATDMIITSGHARESEWNVGFSFPAGQFRPSPSDGRLWAHTDTIGPDAVCRDLLPGMKVKLFDLKNATSLNGQTGVIVTLPAEVSMKGRIAVLLAGTTAPMSVRVGNVRVLETSS